VITHHDPKSPQFEYKIDYSFIDPGSGRSATDGLQYDESFFRFSTLQPTDFDEKTLC